MKAFEEWLVQQPEPKGQIGHAYELGTKAGWKAALEWSLEQQGVSNHSRHKCVSRLALEIELNE